MLLNPNPNGYINKNSVTGIHLSVENYALIGRIVEELIELDEELNFQEFCKAIDILQTDNFEKEYIEQDDQYDNINISDEFP